jgi:hypothetical protein
MVLRVWTRLFNIRRLNGVETRMVINSHEMRMQTTDIKLLLGVSGCTPTGQRNLEIG